MRRLATFAIVAAVTAGGSLWWLYQGDVDDVVGATAPLVGELAERATAP